VIDRARALDSIAAARGQTLAQLALTWVLRRSTVTSAIIGASSVEQLDDSLEAATAEPLTAEELESIEPFAVANP
jgi:L-glyceraldehyde 3-phosphate reductase